MMKSIAKVASGVATGAVITAMALTWTGNQNLMNAEKKAEEFRNAAIQFVDEAKQLEGKYSDLFEENTILNDKITELESTIADLEKHEEEKNKNYGHVKKEFDKANREIAKANADAKQHEKNIEGILDTSIFE